MLLSFCEIKIKGDNKHDGGGYLNLISNLLAGWSDIFKKPTGTNAPPDYITTDYTWMGQIFDTVSIVLYIIMGLVGAAGAIYAIYLGIQLAKADDQSKRDEAKKHLITVLIAVAVTVVLVLFFNLLLPEIIKAFLGADTDTIYDSYRVKDKTTGQWRWKTKQELGLV